MRRAIGITVCKLLVLTVFLVSNCLVASAQASNEVTLLQETSELLSRLEHSFPELRHPQNSNDNLFYKMYHILNGFITGRIKPVQVIGANETVHIEEIHRYLDMPALMVVLARRIPQKRQSYESLFKLGEQEAKDQATSVLSRLILPYMNKLGEAIEYRSKKKLYPTALLRLPSHLAKRELMVIWDLGEGNLYIHDKFFDHMKSHDFSAIIPDESIDTIFREMLQIIPKEFSKENILKAIRSFPKVLEHVTQPSPICLACIGVLCLLMPFVINFICYYLAQALCILLHLSPQVCAEVEAISLLLAFALMLPTAILIWKICQALVCGKAMSYTYKTGTIALSTAYAFLKTML